MAGSFLIDVSRLASRFGGQVISGIDRVELAWLHHLLSTSDSVHGLMRWRKRQLLIPNSGLGKFTCSFVDGRSPNPLAALSPIWPKASHRRAGLRFQTGVFERAVTIGDLPAVVKHRLPGNLRYLNFGHTNLDPALMASLKSVPGLTVSAMIHDSIPLDYPQYQAPGSTERFAHRLEAAANSADNLIYSNDVARQAVEAHLPTPHPNGIVAPFGPGLDIEGSPQTKPTRSFVAISTIEPRKNFDFLLDLWQNLIDDPPPGGTPSLHIIGRQGWADKTLFERLTRMAKTKKYTFTMTWGITKPRACLPDRTVCFSPATPKDLACRYRMRPNWAFQPCVPIWPHSGTSLVKYPFT